jgi:S-formylglutathione hydrolase FrmB
MLAPVLSLAALLLAAASGPPAAPAPSAPAGPTVEWELRQVKGRCGGAKEDFTGAVAIHAPKGLAVTRSTPVVIALHGWGHSPESWRDTPLAALADRHGFVVVAPAMGKSVFESRFYPESKGQWGEVPGACWIGEVILPWVRGTLGLGGDPQRTALIGYSTGARGALVVAERWPRFAFVGALSGTYDLQVLGRDEGEYRIHAKIFGERAQFPERWVAEDVTGDGRERALAPARLWIAHGEADVVVSAEQARTLRARLAPFHPRFDVTIVPGLGHGFPLWSGQLPALVEAMVETWGVGRPPPASR